MTTKIKSFAIQQAIIDKMITSRDSLHCLRSLPLGYGRTHIAIVFALSIAPKKVTIRVNPILKEQTLMLVKKYKAKNVKVVTTKSYQIEL